MKRFLLLVIHDPRKLKKLILSFWKWGPQPDSVEFWLKQKNGEQPTNLNVTQT